MSNNCTASNTPTALTYRAIARAAFLLLCLAGSSGAAEQEAQQQRDEDLPMYVEADSAEFDEETNISVYVGNVIVTQGGTRLIADHVTVHHAPDRKPELIIALGDPAMYRQAQQGNEPIDAHALRMEYDTNKDEITLIKQAVLIQGADRFGSDRIVYDRAQGRVKAGASAQGSERVKITITPDNE